MRSTAKRFILSSLYIYLYGDKFEQQTPIEVGLAVEGRMGTR